jgi:dTDP-4-dehydrorhamnose 3,5-epimerase
MRSEETGLKGVLILKPDVYSDERGYFFESYNEKIFTEFGIASNFVQDNISKSRKNTIRGLHYQVGEYAQGKLCEVLFGRVLDVAVDIRKGSPTYGKYTAAELSDENHYLIWIPEGFAHGFAVLSAEALFHYKCTQFYSKPHERALNYADPQLAIDWRVANPIVSDKDRSAKFFKHIGEDVFHYEHAR